MHLACMNKLTRYECFIESFSIISNQDEHLRYKPTNLSINGFFAYNLLIICYDDFSIEVHVLFLRNILQFICVSSI